MKAGARKALIPGVAALLLLLTAGGGGRCPNSSALIEIVTTPEGIESLRAEPRKRVPAQIRLSPGQELRARVRLKGHGSFRPIDDKPSLTVDFDSAAEGLPRRVHLNNSIEDATCVQERLGREICALAGVELPRVWHARVKLNGRDLGLYVLKEGFTPEFLARIGISADGPVAEDDSNLLSLASKPNWEELDARIAVDELISLMAAEVLLCHWDGYSGSGHNVRVVLNRKDRKYHFLATGMDQLFGNPRYPALPEMTGTLARAVMETPEGRTRFQARLAELSARFDGHEWAARAERYRAELRSSLSFSEYEQGAESLAEFCGRLIERDEYLDRQVGTASYAALK